jgi:hypothetical protein
MKLSINLWTKKFPPKNWGLVLGGNKGGGFLEGKLK